MATISTYTYRRKYRRASLDKLLRKALVVERICEVDRTALKYIDSPYGSQPTTVVQTIVGTYTPVAFTTIDELLTVNVEFIVSEHILDFEETLTKFDVWANRVDEQNNSVVTQIDKFVLNELCEDANGTYGTPAGGFGTAANINIIISNLVSKVAGYAEMYKGLFLVIENTDIPGFIQAQAASGFSFADAALRNGFMTNHMGVDIYVVRAGTFVEESPAGRTWTNANHRVFGVKNVATYAAPRGVRYDEKKVTKKTGKEIVTYGYFGFKAWVVKYDLLIDITLN